MVLVAVGPFLRRDEEVPGHLAHRVEDARVSHTAGHDLRLDHARAACGVPVGRRGLHVRRPFPLQIASRDRDPQSEEGYRRPAARHGAAPSAAPVSDPASDDRHANGDPGDLRGGNGERVALEHRQIRRVPRRDAASPRLLESGIGRVGGEKREGLGRRKPFAGTPTARGLAVEVLPRHRCVKPEERVLGFHRSVAASGQPDGRLLEASARRRRRRCATDRRAPRPRACRRSRASAGSRR